MDKTLYMPISKVLTEPQAREVLNDTLNTLGIGSSPSIFMIYEGKGYSVWRKVNREDFEFTYRHPSRWPGDWVEDLPGEIIQEA